MEAEEEEGVAEEEEEAGTGAEEEEEKEAGAEEEVVAPAEEEVARIPPTPAAATPPVVVHHHQQHQKKTKTTKEIRLLKTVTLQNIKLKITTNKLRKSAGKGMLSVITGIAGIWCSEGGALLRDSVARNKFTHIRRR